MRKFSGLLAFAIALATAPAAATTIDFGSLPGGNLDGFISYSEDGFTVTNLANFVVATTWGDDVPSLGILGQYNGRDGTGSIALTRNGGGLFSLDAFDLSPNSAAFDYTITGLRGGTTLFTVSNAFFSWDDWTTLTFGTTDAVVDRVVISVLNHGAAANIDNIVVQERAAVIAPVPEPATYAVMMLGLGLVGTAIRRRRRTIAVA